MSTAKVWYFCQSFSGVGSGLPGHILGVFNLGGLGEMELLMEEVVDGGGVHAVQMDLLIDHVAVGG